MQYERMKEQIQGRGGEWVRKGRMNEQIRGRGWGRRLIVSNINKISSLKHVKTYCTNEYIDTAFNKCVFFFLFYD